MKILVIVNPQAGEGIRQALRDALDRHLVAVGAIYEIYETRPGDRLAEMVRRRLREGFEFVVAAGGDGTVSDVGNGLVGSSTPLGIIPAGTGNLIAQELDIPTDLNAAVALLAGAHRIRKIDAMRLGDRAYVLNISVGISASVIGGTTRRNKNRFGRIAYVGSTIREMLFSRPRRLVVEVDGRAHPVRAVEVAIMNCGRLGRRLYPKGPEIRVDDGRLGVWILSIKTLWGYPRYAFEVVTGQTANREAQFIRVEKSVAIRSKFPVPVQADGDIIGTTPVRVEVLPAALSILVPGEQA